MGKWQLECFKFGLYIFSPVAAFYWINKFENFEEKIEQFHRAQTSADSIKYEQMIKEYQTKAREERDKRYKEELKNSIADQTNELKEKLAKLEGNEQNN